MALPYNKEGLFIMCCRLGGSQVNELSATDKFVLTLVVFFSMLIEDKFSNLIHYHWALGLLVSVPVTILLMKMYFNTKEKS